MRWAFRTVRKSSFVVINFFVLQKFKKKVMQKYEQKRIFAILLLIFGSFWFGFETSANSDNVKPFADSRTCLVNNGSGETNENTSEVVALPTPDKSETLKIINRYIVGVALVSG